MKKITLSILLGFVSLTVFAQIPVQISGNIEGLKTPQPVKLFKVVNGQSKEIATAIPQDGFKFGFNFYPEYEGLYVVGLGNEGSPNNNFKFYFKPGDKLDFTITTSPQLTYKLNGQSNTKENILLTQWHDFAFPLEDKAVNFMGKISTYVDYFPEQEEIVAKSKTFLTEKSTGNSTFDKLMKDIIRLDLAMFATNFLNTPRTAHPSLEELSEVYATLKTQDFTQNTSLVYQYPWGLRTISGLIRLDQRQANTPIKSGLEGYETEISFVANDTLKGDLLLNRLATAKTIDDFETYYNPYSKHLLSPLQKEKANTMMFPLLEYKPGSDAYQFAYPDINDKTVTLASLKGKVVLVDVWATWCGPCLAEIPALKKLEEEFHGKDVAFVSLSVDEVKDKEKWKTMIKEKELGGIQLFASGWSEFTKYYKINGIPRFLLFDKQGKIVTVDAPRPSNPALKELLDKLLIN